MRSLTREGLVDNDRYASKRIDYTGRWGGEYQTAFYHRQGGLHLRSDGGYYAAMSLCGADGRLDTGWSVSQYKLDIYFDWFDRFDRGDAGLEELDELFP